MANFVPSFSVLRTRLKAVSRVRVVIIISVSSRGLEIENVRVFPFASVSGGLIIVNERYWPALNVKSRGLSK
jgi:hypothetical protein